MTRAVPILFKAPLIRQIQRGNKDVTRRLIKMPMGHSIGRYTTDDAPGEVDWVLLDSDGDPIDAPLRPPCLAGDLLWVRETWQAIHHTPEPMMSDDRLGFEQAASIPKERGDWDVVYAADEYWAALTSEERGFSWRPGIHMPRWASRITLPVVSVRAERLWDITPEDALREGITIPSGELFLCPCEDAEVEDPGPHHHPHCDWRHPDLDGDDTPREVIEFACLWDRINKDRAAWASNPWVWRIEFTFGGAK